jgi:hypothetical protein
MDLIERYLAAVGRQLPATQAADIESELREELLSRKEEREASLGRPLDRAGIEALLLEFGHPLLVAGRYRKTQHLIGPEVFPFWLTTLKWGFAILAIVWTVLMALSVLLGPSTAGPRFAAPELIPMALMVFGGITVAFAAFERFGKAGFLRDWKPSRLPPPDRPTRPRIALAVEVAMGVVFILWWQGLIHFQSLFPYPVQLSVSLAPVWAAWHWPILFYAVWEIASGLLAIARPGWVRTNTGLLVGRYLYGVAILTQVFQAGHWTEVRSPLVTPDVLSIIQANFDLGMRVGIGVAIIGMLGRAGFDLWKAWRLQQTAPARAA